jgi:hypothetical protein
MWKTKYTPIKKDKNLFFCIFIVTLLDSQRKENRNQAEPKVNLVWKRASKAKLNVNLSLYKPLRHMEWWRYRAIHSYSRH